MDSRQLATHIVQQLRAKGFDSYFAGGCVRDELLGRTPKDYDVATSASAEQVQKAFPRTVPVGVAFGVVIVVGDDAQVEVATFRTDGEYVDGRRPESVRAATVEEDARRRDFTVNGMYFDPESQQVLDFVGGRADLAQRVLRAIGDPDQRFQEDHLRLFRAVRFTTELGFLIEPKTAASIQAKAPLLAKTSAERLRDELCKTMVSQAPGRGLRLLSEYKLLGTFLPEAEALHACMQSPEHHPEGDVFTHTAMLLDQLKNPPLELALGALFHDISKPETATDDGKRIRFHGHDRIGAKKTEAILRRLAFSNATIELVTRLVAEHLRFKDAKAMRQSTLKRFFRIDRFDLHLELHRIDCLASHGMLDAYEYCRTNYEAFLREPPRPKPFVTGEDLRALGVTPGPNYKKWLDAVEDAVLEGAVSDRAAALVLLEQLARDGKGKGDGDSH